MNGLLVIVIQVLVDAVLLHHEDLAADSQELVQLIRRQLVKRFLIENKCHGLFADDDAKIVISRIILQRQQRSREGLTYAPYAGER
jgi:hypothetical protein